MILPKIRQTTSAVAAHYNALDSFYREIWGQHVHHGYWATGKETAEDATVALINLLASHLNFSASAHVLDIGCGYGATARYLAKKYNINVTGLTISGAQTQHAQTIPAHNVTILQQDFLANSLPSQSFQRAYAIESSEHMPDKQKFFNEAFRVLQPGGLFGIYAWAAADNPKPWEIKYLLEPICREGRLPSMGNVADYVSMAHNAGFASASTEDISANVSKTWSLCAQRLTKALITKPRYVKFLFNHNEENRIFALTLFRLLAAYRTKSMRYCLLIFRKPGSP